MDVLIRNIEKLVEIKRVKKIELAAICGMSVGGFYAALKNKTLSAASIFAIADKFKIHPALLLSDTDFETLQPKLNGYELIEAKLNILNETLELYRNENKELREKLQQLK